MQPKVSTKQLAEKYPAVLIVDRGSFKLTLYKNLKKAKTYGIAVGQVGLDTPAGLYTIQNKADQPGLARPELRLGRATWRARSSPAMTRRTRSRPAGWGSTTASACTARPTTRRSARAASHGCIRMHVPDVEELYDEVPVGAPIYIA